MDKEFEQIGSLLRSEVGQQTVRHQGKTRRRDRDHLLAPEAMFLVVRIAQDEDLRAPLHEQTSQLPLVFGTHQVYRITGVDLPRGFQQACE